MQENGAAVGGSDASDVRAFAPGPIVITRRLLRARRLSRPAFVRSDRFDLTSFPRLIRAAASTRTAIYVVSLADSFSIFGGAIVLIDERSRRARRATASCSSETPFDPIATEFAAQERNRARLQSICARDTRRCGVFSGMPDAQGLRDRFATGHGRSSLSRARSPVRRVPGRLPANAAGGPYEWSVTEKDRDGAARLGFHGCAPRDGPRSVAAAEKLKRLVERAGVLATEQREGLVDVRAGSARKEELRGDILAIPIAHMSEVGREAAKEQHQLRTTLRFTPSASTFLAFRTAAGSMAAEAETHKDVLIKYGLAVPVLEMLVQMLDQFDAAVAMGNDGRTAHVGATRELKAVASQIVRTVKILDGRNRQRFQDDGQLLGSWISASTVLGTPRGTQDEASPPSSPEQATPNAGDVRPAA